MPPDFRILLAIHRLAGNTPVLDSLMRLAVNDFFSPVALLLILVGLWFAPADPGRRRRHQHAILLAVVAQVIVGAAMNVLNSRLGFDPWPRPFAALPEVNPTLLFYPPQDPSFPSHLAAVESALAGIVLFYNRKAGIVMLVITVLAGLGRVYAGVHYPIDIVGGMALGLMAGGLARLASPSLLPVTSRLLDWLARLGLADIESPARRRRSPIL